MQPGFGFLVLGKLGRRHFLTLGPGVGFLHLFTQHPRGLCDHTIGLRHLTDRAGASRRPPTRPVA